LTKSAETEPVNQRPVTTSVNTKPLIVDTNPQNNSNLGRKSVVVVNMDTNDKIEPQKPHFSPIKRMSLADPNAI
jgi:hypothetical protein